ncbi:cupin domain-containing protein [Methanocella sp. MCL-LM]|uniref:cupin domain-containing protein n=1 Tax=Methanocella sp. MCL-LM TaxID=3412035 RepID=UPI003C7677FB
MESDAVSKFRDGRIIADGRSATVESLPWNEHSTFKGVYLKHLVTGSMTGGRLSCHLIRIEAGHAIGDHVHADKHELHEIISGRAEADVNGKPFVYEPGVVSVIPEGVRHRIVADREDVYLLAKFFPALL